MAKLTFVYHNARIHQEAKLKVDSPKRTFWMNKEKKEIAPFPKGMLVNAMVALAGGRPVRRGWALADTLTSLGSNWVKDLFGSVKVLSQERNIDMVDLIRAQKNVSASPSFRSGLSVSESQSRIVYGDEIIDKMKEFTQTTLFAETIAKMTKLVKNNDPLAVKLISEIRSGGPREVSYWSNTVSQYFAFKYYGQDLIDKVANPKFAVGQVKMISVLDGPQQCLVSSGEFVIELPDNIAQDYLNRYRQGSGLATFADGGILDLAEKCKHEKVEELPTN
jgi:hypothetical protein